MLHHHLPEIRITLTSNSLFDRTMYLVLLQRYEETYLAVGGFCKVAPEELHDREDDGDSNDDDDNIYILTMYEICSDMFQHLFDK